MKDQAVRLKGDTVENLKNIKVEMGGINIKTYDDKINHLVWFYRNFKNNNKKL